MHHFQDATDAHWILSDKAIQCANQIRTSQFPIFVAGRQNHQKWVFDSKYSVYRIPYTIQYSDCRRMNRIHFCQAIELRFFP